MSSVNWPKNTGIFERLCACRLLRHRRHDLLKGRTPSHPDFPLREKQKTAAAIYIKMLRTALTAFCGTRGLGKDQKASTGAGKSAVSKSVIGNPGEALPGIIMNARRVKSLGRLFVLGGIAQGYQ
jgi:hypothetical protein